MYNVYIITRGFFKNNTKTMEEEKLKNDIASIPVLKPVFPIFIKLFLAFFFLSLFTIVANSILVFWTYTNADVGLTAEQSTSLFNAFKSNFIFVILFVIIPAIILSIQMSEDIASPIRLITKNIKEIAVGNLNIKLFSKRKDEFGNLINIFNTMTQKLREVKERNEEISKMKSNFITVASHQLRTPASGVRWGLDALLSEGKGPLNQDQKEILYKCIERNSETIKNIDDLLNASQIEEDNFPYDFQDMHVSPALAQAVKIFENEARIKERKIVFENKLNGTEKIFADPARMSIVFKNLIENAIEYSTKNTDVEVSAEIEGDYILIQVANYGIGIKKEDQDKIFNQFFRADNALLAKPNGIGLGLYICKNIIERHKGRIIGTTNNNGKTVFSVYLPIPKNLITEKPKLEEFLETL